SPHCARPLCAPTNIKHTFCGCRAQVPGGDAAMDCGSRGFRVLTVFHEETTDPAAGCEGHSERGAQPQGVRAALPSAARGPHVRNGRGTAGGRGRSGVEELHRVPQKPAHAEGWESLCGSEL